jgi:type IX secretion system substrate protein
MKKEFSLTLAILIFSATQLLAEKGCECENWQELHPEWIFCDDFESTDPMVSEGRYFEYGDNDGDCIVIDEIGFLDSRGVRVIFQQGKVGAGGFKLAFGRNPSSYMNKGIAEDETFREIYYRMYLKMQKGWQGNPAKLSRATVFHNSNWAQAMIAHLWSDSEGHLLLDPASSVDDNGNVTATKYNDFDNLHWLGYKSGTTPIFLEEYSDQWYCVEMHVKLNDPGESNGVQEFWIDGNLEARREGLNFVGTYTDYAINAVFFENYWNDGSPKLQERYFDNIVVSRSYIGPVDVTSTPDVETNDISVYPNPTIDFIHISVENPDGASLTIEIVDLLGNVVLREESVNATNSIRIDTSSLSSGMYLCRIIGANRIVSRKISIIK